MLESPRYRCSQGRHAGGGRHGRGVYWQASQLGSSRAQAWGTGAGAAPRLSPSAKALRLPPPAGAAGGAAPLPPPLWTAFRAPLLMVDFSVVVAARARR